MTGPGSFRGALRAITRVFIGGRQRDVGHNRRLRDSGRKDSSGLKTQEGAAAGHSSTRTPTAPEEGAWPRRAAPPHTSRSHTTTFASSQKCKDGFAREGLNAVQALTD